MEHLEKIVVAQGNDVYMCVVGSEHGFSERRLAKNLDVLKNYVAGLIDSGCFSHEQLENGVSRNSPWSYVEGEPLSTNDFLEVIKYVTPDPDSPGWV